MLPEKFLTRMKTLLGSEYEDFLASLERDSVRAIRIHPNKMDIAVFLQLFGDRLQRLPYAADGFLTDMEHIGNHPFHHSGAVYVQDPGAMATLHALEVQEGWCVADFCASPGGKSTQLSAYVGDGGFVLSNEINHARCKTLAGNLERLGCRNVLLTNTDSEAIGGWFAAYFDLVLVDAPCSGEGMFRKYDHAKSEWSEENVLQCAERQKEILANAARTVKDGGYLLYSTCTFSIEENEENIDRFLEEHPQFHVCEVLPALRAVTADGVAFEGCRHPQELLRARRFYPHRYPGEGQFICLMQKDFVGERERILYKSASNALAKEELRVVDCFFKDVLTDIGYAAVTDRKIGKYKDVVYLSAADLPLPPHGVYMPGVSVGTVVKGRLEPHHQFYSAFGHLFKRRVDLPFDDERICKYLRGETFSCELDNGYAAVCANGSVLGGIKVSVGVAKNHYPKGLRKP